MNNLITTKTYRIKCNLTFYVDAENEEDAETRAMEQLSDIELEPEFNLECEGKEELGIEKEFISIEELVSFLSRLSSSAQAVRMK